MGIFDASFGRTSDHYNVYMSLHRKARVLLIGLDGASPRLIKYLVNNGVMPTLQSLIRKEGLGSLISVLPYATPAAWSSIYTGVNPGKHGVIDFNDYVHDIDYPGLVDVRSIRAPALWQIISQAGGRVAMIGFPLMYPPPVVNGIVVSGLMTPSSDVEFCSPSTLRPLILAIPGFKPDPLMASPSVGFERGLMDLQNHVKAITEAAIVAHRQESLAGNWDLFAVQFQAVDAFQHMFWAWVDPEDRRHDALPQQERANATRFYTVVDECIRRLIDELAPDVILVVSDHGFGPMYAEICLNQLLLDEELLDLSVSRRRFELMAIAQKMARRIDVFKLRYRLRSSAVKNPLMSVLHDVYRDGLINKASSVAFNVSGGYCGLVRVLNRSCETSSQVKDVLSALKHPRTGEALFENIYSSTDVFTGEYTDSLAGILIVQPVEGYAINSRFRDFGAIAPPAAAWSGTHRKEGVYITNLGNVSDRREEASVLDVMPTILEYLGMPMPVVDGQNLVRNMPASSSGVDSYKPERPRSYEDVYSDKDEQEITDRLRNLGYL
jgi:predicted AlkP superfamily phosphohydrolase/phosphomutase